MLCWCCWRQSWEKSSRTSQGGRVDTQNCLPVGQEAGSFTLWNAGGKGWGKQKIIYGGKADIVLYFYYCIANCHKVGGLGQPTFVISLFLRVRSAGVTCLGPILRRLQSKYQLDDMPFWSWVLWKFPVFVGRIQFLVIVRLRSLLSCWLWAWSSSQLLLHDPLPGPPPMWQGGNHCNFQKDQDLLLKGFSDKVRTKYPFNLTQYQWRLRSLIMSTKSFLLCCILSVRIMSQALPALKRRGLLKSITLWGSALEKGLLQTWLETVSQWRHSTG